MKSPKDMKIIQIEVTNACMHQCSNCTRFCGHHKKPFFMDWETFKRAVDSLEGYAGTIGLMGGEPTLHPNFAEMARYLASKYPQKENNKFNRPQTNFMEAINDLELENTYGYINGSIRQRNVKGPGLFSTMEAGYKKNYEVIQDTILYQALNDHTHEMFHQPALISRKELGITDEEWIPLRDNCWVQNLWSATVTPKGAFFCEIAGALDMLFDGPGGWEIEPGWWKRSVNDFEDQLHWCELCGLACDTFSRDANEGIDDVSPVLLKKLKEINSPKAADGKINVLKIKDGVIDENCKPCGQIYSSSMPYTESYYARFDAERNRLSYKRINGLLLCREEKEIETCMENAEKFYKTYIAAGAICYEKVNQNIKNTSKIKVFRLDDMTLGHMLYDIFHESNYEDYLLYLEGCIKIKKDLLQRLENMILNPGTLHMKEMCRGEESGYFKADTEGSVALLNGSARSLDFIGQDRILKVCNIEELRKLWISEKVIAFEEDMERTAPMARIIPNARYAVYGAGNFGRIGINKIIKNGGVVAMVIDSDEKKTGKEFMGKTIQNIDYLNRHKDEYDYVMIGSVFYYHDIKSILLKNGFQEDKMVLL